ncbi:MAG: linear amide C-N hydrolase [Clostridia bacterium]|nr:linear amide C-N hydrolase [Clostridia bacterium]
MCTAIHFAGNPHFIARTLDYEIGYGERVIVAPRRLPLSRGMPAPLPRHHAIIGMGIAVDETPLYFDAFNEAGLCGAALLFAESAVYRSDRSEHTVASFALLPWVLGQCADVGEAIDLLRGVIISDEAVSAELPPSPLHWIFADAVRAVVVESTRAGVSIIPASAGVLTNEPTYDEQMNLLSRHAALSPYPAPHRQMRGSGAVGLPGDWTSPSRFARAAFLRRYAEAPGSAEAVFPLAAAVAVPRGCVRLPDGRSAHTRYTACLAPTEGAYYHMRQGSTHLHADAWCDFDLDADRCLTGRRFNKC